MDSDPFWRWFDRLHRADFAATLFGLVFDWRPYAAALVGWFVSFFSLPAISLWPPAVIWIASLACGAFISIMYIGLSLALRKRDERASANSIVHEPDIEDTIRASANSIVHEPDI